MVQIMVLVDIKQKQQFHLLRMLPNKRKLNERGFVKSSRMLIGRKIGVGEI